MAMRHRRQMVQQVEPSRTALHEAAHFVAACAYGRKIDFVCTDAAIAARENSDWAGFIRYAPGGGNGDAWSRAVCDLAGEAAETFFLKTEPRLESSDYKNAACAARLLACDFDDVVAVVKEARGAAIDIVKQNTAAVRRLACELDRYGSLNGDVCRSILGPVERGPSRAEMRRAWQEREAHIRRFIEQRTMPVAQAVARRDGDPPNFFRRQDGYMG
jgi:hypothetical protein